MPAVRACREAMAVSSASAAAPCQLGARRAVGDQLGGPFDQVQHRDRKLPRAAA